MSNTGHRLETVDPYDHVDITDEGDSENVKSPHELPTRKKTKRKLQGRNLGIKKPKGLNLPLIPR